MDEPNPLPAPLTRRWQERVQRILEHYETQSEDEALAEDEAAFERPGHTVMQIPSELVPAARELIAKHGK